LDKRIGARADGLCHFFLSSLDGGCTGHVVNFNCNWANRVQENEGTESNLISACHMYSKRKKGNISFSKTIEAHRRFCYRYKN